MERVYCQNEDCGREITKEGGDVSSSGLIFCHGYKDDGESRCLDYEMRLMFKREISSEFLSYNYHNNRQVQRDIKKGKITKFGPLEQKTR